MLIGPLLAITWLILLLRYPGKALPISLAAVAGIALVATWVLWEERQEHAHLAQLDIRLAYAAPPRCPADRPLLMQVRNGSAESLVELGWRVGAFRPGDDLDLAETPYDAPHYLGPGALRAGEAWDDCLPLPPLRPGYRASSLEYRAERLRARFAD
ncbi:multidrug transporter [Pseudomonas mangiferae]|uniref:Multidrug transporter n=1 Tax=Pseudomonas mangiferae TaxID=2593654 RepID=A0A553H1F2_9PSED|nr:multidrug transporter [Pseudomonas mangiferae]TRX75553.1 multidrug transporter [Pseudomonas mangiferae]